MTEKSLKHEILHLILDVELGTEVGKVSAIGMVALSFVAMSGFEIKAGPDTWFVFKNTTSFEHFAVLAGFFIIDLSVAYYYAADDSR